MISGAEGMGPSGGAHRPSDDRAGGQEGSDAPPLQPMPRPTGRFPGLDVPFAKGAAGGSPATPVRRRTITPSQDGVAEATSAQEVFLERIRCVPRASVVVPSLFTQFNVPPEVIQRFAGAYADEVQPTRDKTVARRRYATLAELAESSGLNRHLGFRYGVLNISLDFDEESDAYVEACSARLNNRSQFLVGHGNGAHQTGNQIPVDLDCIDELPARCEDIVRRVGITQFVAHGTQHRVNAEGMAEVFYGATESERKQWVAAANPFIVGLKDFAVMPATTPPGRIIDDAFIDEQSAAGDLDVLFNLYYAGFAEIPSVAEGGIGMPARNGSRFNPHSTYGKLWEPPSATRQAGNGFPVPNLPPAHEGGGTVRYVSVYEMGPNGTVVGEPLLRIELPRP